MTRKRASQPRRGFTLVELMVAIVILAVGVLGLVGTSSLVSKLSGGAAQETLAADMASTRFEKMRSVSCASIGPGSDTTRGMHESWGDSTVANGVRWVGDSITFQAADGRMRGPMVFTSYVRCW